MDDGLLFEISKQVSKQASASNLLSTVRYRKEEDMYSRFAFLVYGICEKDGAYLSMVFWVPTQVRRVVSGFGFVCGCGGTEG